MSMKARKWKHEKGKLEEEEAAGRGGSPEAGRRCCNCCSQVSGARALSKFLLALSWLAALTVSLDKGAQFAGALRLNSIEVPPAVMNSSSQVMLICNFDLQGDQLYSVKWYKNYVEFYRFQPAPEGSAEPSSKLELELDGISLNLARSNATHVCLRQVALQSEGTYKCEVSAESPSFATVSLERQMKVYVLPKQKLTIIDNQALLNENQLAAVGSQLQLSYAVNDLVNLTCLAASSRPAAKLRWLLNEWPVPAASKWLTYNSPLATAGQGGAVESRLTLAFRLQPSHLLNAPSSRLKSAGESLDEPRQNQQLRLKCLGQLSAEFSTESQVLVSGAKASQAASKKQQQQKANRLPMPESLAANTPTSLSLQLLPANQSATDGAPTNYPVYRWPRPQHHKFAVAAGGFRRAQTTTPEPTTTNLFETTLAPLGEHESPLTGRPQFVGRPSGRGGLGLLGSRVASRELRAQADYIEQLLRWSAPNSLGAPIIEREARLINSSTSLVVESEASEADEGVPGTVEGDEETTGGRTESELAWGLDNLSTPPTDGAKAVAGVHITRSSSSSSAQSNSEQVWPQVTATSATPSPPFEFAQLERDYELNEVAQFRCRAQFAPSQSANTAAESTRRLRLKWLINNSELTTNLVNAFDGSRFYYAQRAAQKEARLRQKEPTSANSSSAFDLDSVESKGAVAPSGGEAESELRVEFTPQLFQMKELLTLRCRALVEQALIEFEAMALVSVAAHAQFVEAEPNNKQQRLNANNAARNSTNAGSGYQLRAHRTQTGTRNRARQPPAGSGAERNIELRFSTIVQLAASILALLVVRASERNLFTFFH